MEKPNPDRVYYFHRNQERPADVAENETIELMVYPTAQEDGPTVKLKAVKLYTEQRANCRYIYCIGRYDGVLWDINVKLCEEPANDCVLLTTHLPLVGEELPEID